MTSRTFINLREHWLLEVLIKTVPTVRGFKGCQLPECPLLRSAAQRTVCHDAHALFSRPLHLFFICADNHRVLRLIGFQRTILSDLLHLLPCKVGNTDMKNLTGFF